MVKIWNDRRICVLKLSLRAPSETFSQKLSMPPAPQVMRRPGPPGFLLLLMETWGKRWPRGLAESVLGRGPMGGMPCATPLLIHSANIVEALPCTSTKYTQVVLDSGGSLEARVLLSLPSTQARQQVSRFASTSTQT